MYLFENKKYFTNIFDCKYNQGPSLMQIKRFIVIFDTV